LVCLMSPGSPWYSSCAGLLLLHDTLVHPLFGSGWEISMFCEVYKFWYCWHCLGI
jgi:hypothetical protein